MKSPRDTYGQSIEGRVPALFVVDPNTCGICEARIERTEHFLPVIYPRSFPGPLLRGFRVELCAECHDRVQADPGEIDRNAQRFLNFIGRRIRSGEPLPLLYGGELPRRHL